MTTAKTQIQDEINRAEDYRSREKALASEYLASDMHGHTIGKMSSAEDAALWLCDRAEQDLSFDDHYREQVGPLQPRDFGY